MKTLSCLLLLVVSSAWPASEDAAFVGTWEARLNGKLFARIVVNPGAAPSGTLSFGSIRTGEAGDLVAVESEPEDVYSMLEPRRSGSLLTFTWDDGDGAGKLQLRLLSAGEIELRFLDTAVPVKPFKLKRVRDGDHRRPGVKERPGTRASLAAISV